jgi:hypothetical protein
MEPFTVVDISGWPAANEEYLGTKPKYWVTEPVSGELWLWKEATHNVDKKGESYRKGDDWSERVACEVGRQIGIPVASVELATRRDLRGCVGRRFLIHGEDLVHGNELLSLEESHGPGPRTGYTLEAVRSVLSGNDPPAGAGALPGDAADWFAGYLVLDALIGNTDRHEENWGVIRSEAGTRLAPSFDHASCLGFLLSDPARIEKLESSDKNQSPLGYSEKTRSKFEGQHHPVQAACLYMSLVSSRVGRHWYSAVSQFGDDITPLLARVPENRMSEASRRFAAEVFRCNSHKLSQALRNMWA